jgi:Flp pilus assembly protein TadD
VEECKTLFRKGEYRGTADKLDRVVELVKDDTNAFQFRSYAYFAAGNFDAAAADAYDALLVGNTWNWQAVYDLYQSDKTYTKHLRELEQLAKKSPSMSVHFLLAYQYLVLNHLDHGQKQLEKALALQPDEPLITQLLAVVKQVQAQTAKP